METRPLLVGVWWIGYIVEGSVEYVPRYLDELKRDHPADYKKIFARLTYASQYGPPQNKEQFRAIICVRGQLAEFKGGQARIFCFFDGAKRIVLTNGSFKQGKAPDKHDLERAVRLRDAYANRQ